jgi:putative transcriptional regulator
VTMTASSSKVQLNSVSPGTERHHVMTSPVDAGENSPAKDSAPVVNPAVDATGAPVNDQTEALEQFGAKVREFRKARGLTQHQLAESAGIDRKTINRIENSHYSPTLTNVFAIADALDVPANKLV